MSEEQKTASFYQKVDDIHFAVCGDEFDPSKPGLLRTVQKHEQTLYGEDGKSGISGSNRKLQKYFWMIAGAVILLQAYWAWILAMKTAGGHVDLSGILPGK